MGFIDGQVIHQLYDCINHRAQTRIIDGFHRHAMAWQIQRIDRRLGANGINVEQPVVTVSTEPVDQQNGRAITSARGIANSANTKLDYFMRGIIFFFFLNFGHLKRVDIGVDLVIRDRRRRQNTQESLNRIHHSRCSNTST